MPDHDGLCVATVATELGWLALAGRGSTVWQITFARSSRQAALLALEPSIRAAARLRDWNPLLARRLQEYAAGAADDFRDVELDLTHLTPFARRIVQACRAIGYGQSRSYQEVAAAAGNSRAARAVGNVMAANRFALVVPCHRVVHRGGDAGKLAGSAKARWRLRRLESTAPAAVPRRPARRCAGKRPAKTGARGSTTRTIARPLRSGARWTSQSVVVLLGNSPPSRSPRPAARKLA
jgi:methylated-DNA-[protein]-cysteine S-methyltransferase